MDKEKTSFNNAVHLLIESSGTPQNEKKAEGTPLNQTKNAEGVHPENEDRGTPIPKTDYESIAEMASLMRVETDKFLRDIKDLLESGVLYYSNGVLRNSVYEEFENMCEAKRVPVEKVLTKVMREI